MTLRLDLATATRLAALPLACIERPYPYKSHHVLTDPEHLQLPRVHHPAFYGCFDWHSAVHAHWSLAYLLKRFPELPDAARIRGVLDRNLGAEPLATELAYFSLDPESAHFERPYGWAWLLKLAEELHHGTDAQQQRWSSNLQPLAEHMAALFLADLPKLAYPIRGGEHTNTAFALGFALDYARCTSHAELEQAIVRRARDFYLDDRDAPLHFEPSGHDFLSPCLQELDLMRRVLDGDAFEAWAERFLPGIFEHGLDLTPAAVRDRDDGKLVHLEGLNLSRAWCLLPLAARQPALGERADAHVEHAMRYLFDDSYGGGHWLGSFALYAAKVREAAPGAPRA